MDLNETLLKFITNAEPSEQTAFGFIFGTQIRKDMAGFKEDIMALEEAVTQLKSSYLLQNMFFGLFKELLRAEDALVKEKVMYLYEKRRSHFSQSRFIQKLCEKVDGYPDPVAFWSIMVEIVPHIDFVYYERDFMSIVEKMVDDVKRMSLSDSQINAIVKPFVTMSRSMYADSVHAWSDAFSSLIEKNDPVVVAKILRGLRGCLKNFRSMYYSVRSMVDADIIFQVKGVRRAVKRIWPDLRYVDIEGDRPTSTTFRIIGKNDSMAVIETPGGTRRYVLSRKDRKVLVEKASLKSKDADAIMSAHLI